MTYINKQNFLTELGKLLTFMYEEDRQTALSLYNAMFEDCGDEQQLIQHLMSPTRQAVVVARAYDAKERKLQVEAQKRGDNGKTDDNGELPNYVKTINKVYEEFRASQLEKPVALEDQYSFFDAPETPSETAVPETAPVAEPESAEDAAPEFSDDADDNTALVDDIQSADTSDGDDGEDEDLTVEIYEEEDDAEDEYEGETYMKPRVLLLILYIILAIPVGIIGVALLLIPTLVSLALAVGTVAAGIMILNAALGGFAVLADLLVVLGAAVVVLALGLFFCWLFVWFIGGAIVGLIRGLVHLGGKWCYKEVRV